MDLSPEGDSERLSERDGGDFQGTTGEEALDRARRIAGRVLAREDVQDAGLESSAVQEVSKPGGSQASSHQEWEARTSTYRSGQIAASTELEDVSQVEYRKVRLESVVLVRLHTEGTREDTEHSLAEMEALARTAGASVAATMVQARLSPDPATYLGRGKALELKRLVEEVSADTVIVDGDLTPSQRRALEDVVGVKVVDRTAVILDIFAQHAKSREGKAQVELAQLEYLLPRLRGWGESMSRQAGGRVAGGAGIGSRGPGETKLELDRRRIRQRMGKLRKQIKRMSPARKTQRSGRDRHEVPSVAIAGYTNAGKSTLLNAVTGDDLLTADALFATLDPTVRKAETGDGRNYTLTDTVGFVRSLPTQLVEAFRSTLEEIGAADVVLHVVDASAPNPEQQVDAVRDVLGDIPGYESSRELLVLNKVDLTGAKERARLRALYPEAIEVSAATGDGIGALKDQIAAALPSPAMAVDLLVPFESANLVSAAYEEGEVEAEEWTAEGVRLTARVSEHLAALLSQAAKS